MARVKSIIGLRGQVALVVLLSCWLPIRLGAQAHLSTALVRAPWAPRASSAVLSLTPVTLDLSYRSAWTDDRENGALWAGKGLSGLLRGGMVWHRGRLEAAFIPEVTWASNGAFPTAPPPSEAADPFSAPWIAVDLPRRWGESPVARVHPGQSIIQLRWDRAAVGFTTQAMTRGPEIRYPIIMGVSAPGAPTVFMEGAVRPRRVGHLALRAQWGVLHESPWFDVDPQNARTLLSLFMVDWAPSLVPGLTLGVSLAYRDPIEGGLTPSMFLQAFSTASAQDPSQQREDGLAGFHARWDAGPLRLWGSWGREDYWLDVEDLLTEPDHSQLFSLGSSLAWQDGAGTWLMSGEVAGLAGTLGRQRDPFGTTSNYRHNQATHGHTHQGQMLGASIGPGSQGAWVRIERTDSTRSMGIEFERILRDLDAYHKALRRPDGTAGEDREWRLGLLYEGPIPRLEWSDVGMKANGGLSVRWNRDYVRYSSNAHLVGPRESQFFLDLSLTWDPWQR